MRQFVKNTILCTIALVATFLFFACTKPIPQESQNIKIAEDVEIVKLSDKAYMHISFMQTQNFGKVGANGLILVDEGEAYLFDTPWNNSQTETLVNWMTDSLHATVTTFVPNHWHEDCMGGLEYLQTKGIESYANQMTIDIAKEKKLPLPQHGFTDSITLKLHDIDIHCYYLGGGHSTDNIVVWIPSEKMLFGGCPIKDIHAQNLGNLADADLEAWPQTMKKMRDKFKSVEIVIPGHGKIGKCDLIEHTLELLKK